MNASSSLAPYLKTVVAIVGVVLTLVNAAYGSDARVQAVIALAVAFGVYHAKNQPTE